MAGLTGCLRAGPLHLHTAFRTMPILSAAAKSKADAYSESRSSGGGKYLRTSDIESGGKVRFTILSDDTQTQVFYELWVESLVERREDNTPVRKCLRWAEPPTRADIETRLADEDCTSCSNKFGRPETVKFVIALAVWNYDAEAVQVFAPSQPTITDRIKEIASDEEVEPSPTEWDIEMSRKDLPKKVEYTLNLRPGRRKKPLEEAKIAAAWQEALDNGFDLSRLLTGGDPFQAEAF